MARCPKGLKPATNLRLNVHNYGHFGVFGVFWPLLAQIGPKKGHFSPKRGVLAPKRAKKWPKRGFGDLKPLPRARARVYSSAYLECALPQIRPNHPFLGVFDPHLGPFQGGVGVPPCTGTHGRKAMYRCVARSARCESVSRVTTNGVLNHPI